VITGSALAAIPASILAGLIFVSLFAVITIRFRADQIVTGTALNILAFGTSTTLWHALQNYMTGPTPHDPPKMLFDRVALPFLSSIPLVGPALFDQYSLFYLVIVLATMLAIVNKTRYGLIIRSLGDAPDACDAAGIPVRAWRIGLTLFAGACAGLAGAYLSTMRGHSFQVNMTAGQGFLVLALVIFGRWKLSGLIAGTLLFGALDGLQSYLAAIPGATTKVPHQLFDMLPYAATLIALGVLTRSRAGPAYLAVPWPPDR
jgi:simple sugar transport system permease protein